MNDMCTHPVCISVKDLSACSLADVQRTCRLRIARMGRERDVAEMCVTKQKKGKVGGGGVGVKDGRGSERERG